MKLIFYILSVLTVLTSCDPYSSAKICNDTETSVEVILHFNKANLINRNGEGFPMKCLRMKHVWYPNWKLIELDSVNLVGRYSILPNSCAIVYEMNSRKPDFTEYESITVLTNNDTLVMDSNDKMEHFFGINRDIQNFDLTIN